MSSLEFVPGVVSGGGLNQEAYERRRDACTREFLARLTTSPEYLAHARSTHRQKLSRSRVAFYSACIITSAFVLLSVQLLWTDVVLHRPDVASVAGNPEYNSINPTTHHSLGVQFEDSCSVLLPLQRPWEFATVEPLNALPETQLEIVQEMLLLTDTHKPHESVTAQPFGASVVEFTAASRLAAQWLCCVFILWTFLQLLTQRFRQSVACTPSEIAVAANNAETPVDTLPLRDPLYGQLLILEAEVARKNRDLKLAQQRALEFESKLEESETAKHQLQDALNRLIQTKGRLEADLIRKSQQLEVLQSISESLDGQVDQLVHDQVLELFETPERLKRSGPNVQLSSTELKGKLEQTIQQKLELRTQLEAAEDALAEKDKQLSLEHEKVKELDGKVRSLNEELATLKDELSSYAARSRFGTLSPSGTESKSPNFSQDRQRELQVQHDADMQHLLSRAEEEKAKAVGRYLESQTQLQQLQQDKIMLQQVVVECQATIIRLRLQNSQLKEQASSTDSSRPLSPTLSFHSSCPPSPASATCDKENVTDTALTPRMQGSDAVPVEFRLHQLKAANKDLQEQLAEKIGLLQQATTELDVLQEQYRECQSQLSAQERLLAFEREEKDLLSTVRNQLQLEIVNQDKQIAELEQEVQQACHKQSSDTERLLQQVEQLTDELTSLLSVKNTQEARVQELEQELQDAVFSKKKAHEQHAELQEEYDAMKQDFEYVTQNLVSAVHSLETAHRQGHIPQHTDAEHGHSPCGSSNGSPRQEPVEHPDDGTPAHCSKTPLPTVVIPEELQTKGMGDYLLYKVDAVQRRWNGQPSPGPRFRFDASLDPQQCMANISQQDKVAHVLRVQQKISEVQSIMKSNPQDVSGFPGSRSDDLDVEALLEYSANSCDQLTSSPSRPGRSQELDPNDASPLSAQPRGSDVSALLSQSFASWSNLPLSESFRERTDYYALNPEHLPSSYGPSDAGSPAVRGPMFEQQLHEDLEAQLNDAEQALRKAEMAEEDAQEEMKLLQERLDLMEECMLHTSPGPDSEGLDSDQAEHETLELLQKKQLLAEKCRRLAAEKQSSQEKLQLIEMQLAAFEVDGGDDEYDGDERGYDSFEDDELQYSTYS